MVRFMSFFHVKLRRLYFLWKENALIQ